MAIKTYQDLEACGTEEKDIIAFILSAIADHKNSVLYKTAVDAQLYYNGENPTINRYEKILYDMQGIAQKDMYSANHKIASRFFGFVVDQEASYLLGNGVSFGDESTKEKLGKDFDKSVQKAGEFALVGGVSFGFWNLDHVEIFSVTEFAPLYDEENGALRAGIRFWQIAKDKPFRCTLYTEDGYIGYIQRPGNEMTVSTEKRPYKFRVTSSEVSGDEIYEGENYPSFPIVPLKNNRLCKSEICGHQNTIDALDLACSNMINNVDEGNLIYWALINCGGMDYEDASKFLQRVRMTKVAFVEDGGEGATATPHAIEAPYAGTQTTIDMFEKKLYQDFQAFDASAVTAGSQTATAIKASYVPLDLKCDKFEMQVTEFVNGILELAGIDDEPTYTRNKIISVQEEVQTVLTAAEYLDEEYMTRKLLTLLGDADMVQDVMDRRSSEELERFDGETEEPEDGDAITAEEALDTAESVAGKTLNGSQTASLITVIRQLSAGSITEGQAVRILTTSIGIKREEALAIIRGEE